MLRLDLDVRKINFIGMSKPILKISLKPFDWIIEGITLFILIGVMVYFFIHYSALPDTIPTHYGFSGKADGFGGKSTLLILLVMLNAIYLFLTGISRKPHWFNYAHEITESNAPRQYFLALQSMRIVKLVVVIIFSYIIVTTMQIAQDNLISLGTWFIPTVLFILFATIIFYAIRSSLKSSLK
jgi:uncharacterized membrane protein